MSQNLLGLDIGSYSIKAALFSTTFKSFSLTDLYESPPLQLDDVEPQDRSVILREALTRLLTEHSLAAPTVVTAVSGSLVSTRNLTLPLPERQVEKVLPFELESYLPFELDEILVTHHTIHSTKTETHCLAAAVKKTVLQEHLKSIQEAGLDPAFVTLDSLALYNLHQLSIPDQMGTFAIVDLGHQKTSICIVSGGRAEFVRTLMSGGLSITESIQSELNLTREQAMDVKHTHGIIELEKHPLQSKDLRRLSGAVRLALDPLLREILQTFQAYRAQTSQTPQGARSVEHIYLCGGTSMIRNLPEYFSELSSVPAQRLEVFPPTNEAYGRLGSKEPIMAQAVALGMRVAARGANAKKTATLNFRSGPFAFARDLSDIKEKAIFFSRWIGIIFVLALLHLGFRYQNLARQNSQMEKTILKTFNEIAPNENPKPKTASLALKVLESRIQKYADQQSILTAGLNELTALGILNEISRLMPQDVLIDTQELSIDRNKITLRANTDSYGSVDRVIADLKKNPKFGRIEKGSMQGSPDGKVGFLLTVTVGEEDEAKNNRRPK